VCEERGVKIEIEIEIEIEIDRSGNRNRNRNRNRGIIESDSCKLVVKWFFVQVFILLLFKNLSLLLLLCGENKVSFVFS